MNITKYPQNFIAPEHKPEDLVFGSVNSLGKSLSGKVLREDGQWTDYLPEDESQVREVETSNCTAFGTCNAVEILLEELGVIANYSDRFLGIAAGTRPPGNAPNKVAQAARDNGFLDEIELPFTGIGSINEYYSPDPLPQDLLSKALEWKSKYSFGYDWVANGFVKASPEKMMEALRYSPLGVAVFAWANEGEKYVRPPNTTDTHWTLIVGYKVNEYWLCLDSYSPHVKKLAWDFGFSYVMRFSVDDQPAELATWQKIINLLAQIVGLQALYVKQIVEKKVEPPREVKPELPEKIDWKKWFIGDGWGEYAEEGRKEACKMAKRVCEEEGLPDWMKRELLGTIAGESKYNVFCINRNRDARGNVSTTDFGISQLNDFFYLRAHNMTGDEALNNPEKCVRIMCQAFKAGRAKDWIAWRNHNWEKHLVNVPCSIE